MLPVNNIDYETIYWGTPMMGSTPKIKIGLNLNLRIPRGTDINVPVVGSYHVGEPDLIIDNDIILKDNIEITDSEAELSGTNAAVIPSKFLGDDIWLSSEVIAITNQFDNTYLTLNNSRLGLTNKNNAQVWNFEKDTNTNKYLISTIHSNIYTLGFNRKMYLSLASNDWGVPFVNKNITSRRKFTISPNPNISSGIYYPENGTEINIRARAKIIGYYNTINRYGNHIIEIRGLPVGNNHSQPYHKHTQWILHKVIDDNNNILGYKIENKKIAN